MRPLAASLVLVNGGPVSAAAPEVRVAAARAFVTAPPDSCSRRHSRSLSDVTPRVRPLRILFVAATLVGCSSSQLEPDAPEAADAPRPLPRRPICAGIAIAGAGHDYCLMRESASFADAKTRCRRTGLQLASVSSSEENGAIASALAGLSPTQGAYAFWVGLERKDGEWRWPSAASYAPSTNLPWAPNEPNNAGGNESCGEYIIGANVMNDLPCDAPRPFVCERPAADPREPWRCDGMPVATKFGGYCLYPASSIPFAAAAERCKQDGATLADLSTPGEARALSAATASPIDSASVWIGASDEGHERAFEWTNGAPVTFSAWGPGEPNNAGVENCTELIIKSGKWNDMKCEAKRPPLCEAPSRMSASYGR